APVFIQDRPRTIHRDGDAGTQTSVSLAFRAPGELDPDFAALIVLGRILDDGMSTRLYQRIVNELGLAYYVSAGLDAFADVAVFEMEATAVHRSVPQLLGEMLGLLTALRAEAVTADELTKVRR